ncbi:MAG: TIGR03118 family protein [Rhodospirillaceae bacterium]
MGAAVLALGAAALATGASGRGYGNPLGSYKTHNLVSDQAGKADLRDPSLVNAWGLSFGANTPAWVADNGSDVSTLYTGDQGTTQVKKLPLTVKIPGGAPTGTVFNGTDSFAIKPGGPASFLFSSEAGKITGWNGTPASRANTVASVHDAIFKGLAIADTSKGPRLYATDFHNNRVDVWDGAFMRVHQQGAFRDPKLPNGYAPFGIDTIKGDIVVSYAKQDAKAEDDVSGAGHGFIDVYSEGGKLLKRFASRGALNSPWGIAMAPKGFGGASGDMLIGNFGDGKINVYNPKTGAFLGQLDNATGNPISIDGLWALEFGNGVIGTPKTLLFTAGPNDEKHGLFGDIKPG